MGVSGDTTSHDSVRQAVAEAVALSGGGIDLLVNAAAEPAGFAAPPKLGDITGDLFHAELDTKVMGSSAARARSCPACTAAAWLRARAATPWAASVTSPWCTRAERTAALLAARAAARGVAPQVVEDEMAVGNSIRRLVNAAEVADVVAFLCSTRSRAINGDSIAAGGGAPCSIHH